MPWNVARAHRHVTARRQIGRNALRREKVAGERIAALFDLVTCIGSIVPVGYGVDSTGKTPLDKWQKETSAIHRGHGCRLCR